MGGDFTSVDAIDLAREALVMTVVVGGPMLAVGLVVGLIVSIVQTATSIQEQTLTFVPKILAMLVSVVVFGPWMIRELSDYTIRLILRMATLAP